MYTGIETRHVSINDSSPGDVSPYIPWDQVHFNCGVHRNKCLTSHSLHMPVYVHHTLHRYDDFVPHVEVNEEQAVSINTTM